MLDLLIEKWYEAISQQVLKDPKIGELIKLIETRMKLAPGDTGKKDLLNLLEKIRRENLPGKKAAPVQNNRPQPKEKNAAS